MDTLYMYTFGIFSLLREIRGWVCHGTNRYIHQSQMLKMVTDVSSVSVSPSIPAANMVATQEWMTVIDAAIQGVPEQAKRRLRTVTNHFSVRKKPNGKEKLGKTLSGSGSSGSLSGLEERGLDLVDSVQVAEDGSTASPLGGVETE